MTTRNPFAKDLPEVAHGLREQAASEIEPVSGGELHAGNSDAAQSESMPNTKSGEDWCAHVTLARIYRDERDAALKGIVRRDDALGIYDAEVTRLHAQLDANDDTIKRFDRERQGLKAAIAQRDAEIERMAADLLAKDDTIDRLTRVSQIIMATSDDNLAAKDATIDRLWAQLNEATNVPDRNDPEFGFDKTAALSEPDEDDGREALATRLRALYEDAEDRRDWVRVADLRAMLGTS